MSLHATHVLSTKSFIVIHAHGAHVLNIVKLHDDICTALPHDPTVALLLPSPISIPVPIPKSSSPQLPMLNTTVLMSLPYTCNSDGFVCRNGQIYMPTYSDLCLYILQFKHDHIISGG